jgi:chromosome segregation ATPase
LEIIMSILLNALTNLVYSDPTKRIDPSWDKASRDQFVQDRIFKLSKYLKLENGPKEIKWESGLKSIFILKNTATGNEYDLSKLIHSDSKVGQVFNDLKQVFDGKRPGFIEPTKEPEDDAASLKSDSSAQIDPVKPLLDEHQNDRSNELHESSKPYRHRRDSYGDPICSRCHKNSSRRSRKKYRDSYSSDDDARYLSRPHKSAKNTFAAFSPADFLAFEHLKKDLEQTRNDLQTTIEERDIARKSAQEMHSSLMSEKERANRLASRALLEAREKLAAHQDLDNAYKLRDQAQERASNLSKHLVALSKSKDETLKILEEVQNGAQELINNKDATIDELRNNMHRLENVLRHSQIEVDRLKDDLRAAQKKGEETAKLLKDTQRAGLFLLGYQKNIIDDLRNNIHRLENALRHSQIEVVQLKRALNTAGNERDSLVQLIQGFKDTVTPLLDHKNATIEALRNTINGLENALRHSQIEVDRLKDDLKTAKNKEIGLIQDNDTAIGKNIQLQIEVDRLKNDLRTAKNKEIGLLQDNDTVLGKNIQLQKDIKAKNKKILELESNIKLLEEANHALEVKNIDNLDEKNRIVTERNNIKRQIANAESQIETLKNAVSSLEATKNQLQTELGNAKQEISHNQQIINDLQTKLELSENDLFLSQISNGNLGQELAQTQVEKFRLRQSNSKLTTERDNAKKTLEEANKQLRDLRAKSSELESRLSNQDGELKNLNTRLDISNQAAKNASLEKKTSEAKVKDLETQLDSLKRSNQSQVESLRQQLTHLQRGLGFANRENTTLKLDQTKLTLQINTLKRNLEGVSKENSNLNARNSNLFSEINQLKQKLETLETNFAAKEASLRRDLESARVQLKIKEDSLQEKDKSQNEDAVNFERVQKNLAQQIEVLKADLKNERSKGLDIAAKQSEIDVLQRQLEALQSAHNKNIKTIRDELAHSHSDNRALHEKAANIEKQLNDQRNRFTKEQKDLNNKLNQLSTEKQTVETSLLRSNREKSALNEQLASTKKRLEEVIAENNAERIKLINDKNEIEANKAKEIQSLQVKLAALKNSQEIPKLQAEILAEKDKTETATRNYQRALGNVRKLQSQISALQKSNQGLKDALNEKNNEFLIIERNNLDLYKKMESLNDSINKLREEKSKETRKLTRDLNNEKSKKADIHYALDQSYIKIEEINREIEKLTTELNEVRKDREGIRKVSITELDIIKEKNIRIKFLEEQLKRLQQESSIRPISNSSSSESSNEDESALRKAQDRIRKELVNVQAKHVEIEHLKTQLHKNDSEISEKSEEIENLKAQIKEFERSLQAQNDRNNKQENRLNELSSNVKALTTENRILNAENDRQTEQIIEIQKSSGKQADKTQEITDLRERIAFLEKEQNQGLESNKSIHQIEFERIINEKDNQIRLLQDRLYELTERTSTYLLDGRSDSEFRSPDSSHYSSRNSSMGNDSDIDWSQSSVDLVAANRQAPTFPLRRAFSEHTVLPTNPPTKSHTTNRSFSSSLRNLWGSNRDQNQPK